MRQGLGRAAAAGLVGLAILTGCAGPGSSRGGESSQGVTLAPQEAAVVPAPSFDLWLAGLRTKAMAAGIAPATLDRALTGLAPDEDVIRADRNQPEFERQPWTYLDSAVSESRIAAARSHVAANRPLFTAVERRYGVPAPVLAAIWGMESNFGSNCGNQSVIRSLATLGYEGRRRDFATDQLLAAFRIIERDHIDPARLTGSWAGAMGQTQFIPTVFLQAAVAQDGNGRPDIWNSVPDVIASTANFLAQLGWRAGEPWGREVRLPAGFDDEQADLAVSRPLAAWRRAGIMAIGAGRAGSGQGGLDGPDDRAASVILPGGHGGPAFLVFENFRVFMRYNASTSYALAAGLLADRIAGGPGVVAAWPRQIRPLARDERLELQRLLAARGLDVGVPDGIVGQNTRRAIRVVQKQAALPADGFPTPEFLDLLRGVRS